jgi:hypothetical protein
MKKLILLGLLSVLSTSLVAQETKLELICTYSHTLNDQNEFTNTSGDVHFIIIYKDFGTGKIAKIKKDNLEHWFLGKITDSTITGETSYKIGKNIFEETLDINRNTGKIHITFKAEGKKSGLIHFGKCKKHVGKLF